MTYARSTVARDIKLEGRGLHTGNAVSVAIRPGNSGIRFRLGNETWEAKPENVTDTTRSTRLGDIGTVEHLMSAFAGMEVTDADVEVSTAEMPALDGSSKLYVEALTDASLEPLGTGQFEPPFSRVFVQNGDAKVAISAGSGHWRYEFHTGDRWPGIQVYESEHIADTYRSEVSEARTFGFQEELAMIEARGLAKGLDAESALILGANGYLNPERFVDEPVRHKMLDAVGDVYLAGIPIRFLNVVAVRTGHKDTVKAAGILRQQVAMSQSQ